MYAESFEYHQAETVDHAIELLESNEGAKVLAGGHGLIPLMKKRELTPDTVVDIGELDALEGIERTDEAVRIGALATHSTVGDSALLREAAPVYPRTVSCITGGKQVHNFATIGGNIARAHPGYDYEGTVLATGSQIRLHGPAGEQTVAASEFFRGALTTSLDETQLITSIIVPTCEGDRRGGYAKRKEPGSGNAIVGVATDIQFGSEQAAYIERARIGVNGLQESAVRLTAVEDALTGSTVTEQTVQAAAATAGESVQASAVLDNKKASAAYRRNLLEPQVRKSVMQATRLGDEG